MTFQYAILGLLSRGPLSGYDLKKLIADSSVFYWSGNNNQIYRTLVQLDQDGWVQYAVELQTSLPAKKVYSITEIGLAELKSWLGSAPELLEMRSNFLIRVAWLDILDPVDRMALLDRYVEDVRVQLLMEKEKSRRAFLKSTGHLLGARLAEMIAENLISFYENELAWLQKLRAVLIENE